MRFRVARQAAASSVSVLALSSFSFSSLLLCLLISARLAAAACVPDFPEKLLSDAVITAHPLVVAAFAEVQRILEDLYVNTTRDGLSFGVVSLF